jgi:Domain of unknown function (DUF4440)
MKKLLSIALIATCGMASAQNAKQAIIKVLKQQESDWNSGSIANYMNGYWKNDSLVFIGKKGPKYGWQTTFDTYVKNYPADKMGKLDFSKIKVDLMGEDHAQAIGHWHLTRPNDEPQGYFTLIFKRFGKDWRIISDHTE